MHSPSNVPQNCGLEHLHGAGVVVVEEDVVLGGDVLVVGEAVVVLDVGHGQEVVVVVVLVVDEVEVAGPDEVEVVGAAVVVLEVVVVVVLHVLEASLHVLEARSHVNLHFPRYGDLTIVPGPCVVVVVGTEVVVVAAEAPDGLSAVQNPVFSLSTAKYLLGGISSS